jgi:hypothetical protein
MPDTYQDKNEIKPNKEQPGNRIVAAGVRNKS